MKYNKYIVLFLAAVFHVYLSYSQSVTEGNPSLNANMKYTVFYSPEVGPYVETYLLVNGNTVTYLPNEADKMQAAINLSIVFQKNDTVAKFSKIQLKSPEIDSKTGNVYDFMDCQRFPLPNGTYEMIVRISDAAHPEKEFEHREFLDVDYQKDIVYVSGIELLESYEKSEEISITTKNGFKMIPRISTFYPENIYKLSFYCEFYNTPSKVELGTPYLVTYFLRGYESQQQSAKYSGFKRINSAPVNVLINSIDITDLASGNYELVVELRDRENNILSKNVQFFQRSNPNIAFDENYLRSLQIQNSFAAQYTSIDTLREFIAYLYPKASNIEKQFIFNQAKTSDIEMLQRFFYNFWMERNALNPYQAWLDYKKMVEIVNHEYKAVGMKGFQTDRGRVYLQYGPPNTIVDREYDSGDSGLTINEDGSTTDQGGSIPYQIWHYYQLSDNQRNKRFVFANPHLAANTYDLIHSDANGELYNPQWQSELQRQIFKSTTTDENGKFKGKSGEFYNVPY